MTLRNSASPEGRAQRLYLPENKVPALCSLKSFEWKLKDKVFFPRGDSQSPQIYVTLQLIKNADSPTAVLLLAIFCLRLYPSDTLKEWECVVNVSNEGQVEREGQREQGDSEMVEQNLCGLWLIQPYLHLFPPSATNQNLTALKKKREKKKWTLRQWAPPPMGLIRTKEGNLFLKLHHISQV